MSAVSDIRRAAKRIRPALGDGTSTLISLHIVTAVLRLGSNLIVSRLFAPEVYGAIGVIMSITFILQMTSDLGFNAYITRHRTADVKVLHTVWTVRLIRNVILTSVMALGAGFLANLYSAPEIAEGVRAAAFLILLGAFPSAAMLTAERDRRIIRLSVIDFSRTLLVISTTIVAAYFLRTYWAVIIAMFAGGLFTLFASYRLMPGPPMRLRLKLDEVLDLWRFSRIIVPSSIIGIILTQTDKFFLANFFPLAELGKFMLASSITMAIVALNTQYVMRVFYPLIAQVLRQNPQDALKTYYASRRRYTLIMAFLVGGVVGGGALVTQILFNDNYLGAGFYLSILAILPLAKLITHPAQQALIAKGFVRATLTSNFVRLGWVLVAGPIAYFQFGPLAVVIVMCLAEAVTIPYFWWKLRRFELFSLRSELLVLAAAAIGIALGYAANAASDALIAAGYLPSF